MSLRPNDFLVDDEQFQPDLLFNPKVDGERKGHGLVPRDYKEFPREMFDPPNQLPLIPKSEWSDRIKELESTQSALSHLRAGFPALDQNGQGYCWYYSTTSAVMLTRKVMNQPYVRLSAHAGACMIKNFRDEGGWCGLSAQRQKSHGTPSVAFWPEKSMSRANDRPETWANALGHKVTEDWIDLTRDIYDQNLTFEQLATCLLCRIPCAVDFNWWGHSVCAMDLVEVEPGSFGIRILNSWSDSWGEQGSGVLRGSKAIPNGAVCMRVSGASPD